MIHASDSGAVPGQFLGLRELVRMRVHPEQVKGLVLRGAASPPRCAPIGPLATPRDPRARLSPQAGRTDASPVRPARATPGIEACAAARFSPKADGRARCATAEARLRRRVLHGSAFRHVRRNRAARTASGGVWRRAAGKTCAQEPGRRKSVKAPQPSPEGFTLFLRAGPCPQADLLMAAASPCATPPAGIPASSRRESGACATRTKTRAVSRPCARRTGTTPASGGASSMPRRRGGSAAVRRARRGGGSGSGGVPPREPPGGTGGCVAARTWRRACRKEEPSSRARATARRERCKGCARSGRHAECPVEMDAARRSRPGGWTGVRRRGMRTMGCAISTGRRGAAAGARFQISNTHRQMQRAPQPQKLTGYVFVKVFACARCGKMVKFAPN